MAPLPCNVSSLRRRVKPRARSHGPRSLPAMTDRAVAGLLGAGGARIVSCDPNARDPRRARFLLGSAARCVQLHQHGPDLWVVLATHPYLQSPIPCRTLGELRAALLALEMLTPPLSVVRQGCPVCSMWGLL
jgi:hypothetical protein